MNARNRSARQRYRPWLVIAAAIVVLILIAPTIVVIPMSFSGSTTFEFPPQSWSLRWYEAFFGSVKWRTALVNSLLIGVCVAALSTVLGTLAAVSLKHAKGRMTRLLSGALMAPMVIPGIIVAVAIYASFLQWRLSGTFLGFVIAHAVLAIPFVFVAVNTALDGFDLTTERAAGTLGANPVTAFVLVTVPQILPGLLSGFVFAFATSFDEVVVALFLQSPTLRTLPVLMFESVTIQIDPTIGAASSIIVVATSLIILVPQLIRRERKNA